MSYQNTTIGFIGAGNMGTAMIRGIINGKITKPNMIIVFDTDYEKAAELSQELGITIATSASEVVKSCNIIVPAVKPMVLKDVLSEIADYVKPEQLILSIAAGVSIAELRDYIKNRCHVIRTMPNAPALVGKGMTAICEDTSVPEEFFSLAIHILESFGNVELIKESQIHAATAISGSSPAYGFLFIEALADGGVKMGLSREKSYKMAAQALAGAAEMIIRTGKHPGELKDMVCSPGGTTIEAVSALEYNGFRGAIIKSIQVCAQKSIEMEKKGKQN